ncbi:LysR family transcriptional regulator [Vibrio sp. VB16]|uniref:LysR family transcriptional regulator n=1 Tax=Vibrio sp. VB16 TaxID=2785746 RepID=UPI00189FC90A|nr:LysR family transcriptional regulator [Vibrio sp. VB16]UGA53526.1 LysR family transcriptional regulator [Vibrio sp. VB16]
MDYSLSEIRAYNAIIKCGNFSRAAEKLNVSQPAVTAQIRKLESRFEYPLLERFSKGVSPTELGKRLYHLSCQYEDLDKAIDVLANPDKHLGNVTLKVATASTLVFMPLIAQFRQRFPDVTLKLISAPTAECCDLLLKREVDIALCPMRDDLNGVSKLPFHTHSLVAIIPLAHPLAQCSEVSFEQLSRESLIYSRPFTCTQSVVDDYFNHLNLQPNTSIVMDNRQEICEAVAYNLGIGFVLENDIHSDPRFCIRPIKEVDNAVEEHVSWLKNRSVLPGIKDFVQQALELRCHSDGSLSFTP